MKIRLKKEGDSFSNLIGAVSEILPDGSFKTTCILGSKNQFGRDMSDGIYRWRWENPHNKTVAIVTPLIPYEVFEVTENPNECKLLAISYYMGTDYNDVIKTIDKKKFVVDEKLIVSERIPNTLPEQYTKSRFNSILRYAGLKHLPKENPKYEGDCCSLIELANDCKYTMYKFIKIVTPTK